MFTQRGLSYIQGASKGKNVDLYRIYQEDARVHHQSTAREKAIQSAPLPSAVAGKGKLCGLDDPRKARAQCMHHIITHTHMHTHTHTHTHTHIHTWWMAATASRCSVPIGGGALELATLTTQSRWIDWQRGHFRSFRHPTQYSTSPRPDSNSVA
jgi:hypothetical protein